MSDQLFKEFHHVSQLYQTIFGLSFASMFAILLIAYIKQVLPAILLQRDKQDEQYLRWKQINTSKYADTNNGPSESQIKKKENQQEVQEPPKVGPVIEIQPPKKQQKVKAIVTQQPEDGLTETQRKIFRIYIEINALFDQYLPVIMCALIVGMMTASTQVFSLAMFFCYLFSTLMFNYLKIQGKSGSDAHRPYLRIIPGVFMIALFASYFIRVEFSE